MGSLHYLTVIVCPSCFMYASCLLSWSYIVVNDICQEVESASVLVKGTLLVERAESGAPKNIRLLRRAAFIGSDSSHLALTMQQVNFYFGILAVAWTCNHDLSQLPSGQRRHRCWE